MLENTSTICLDVYPPRCYDPCEFQDTKGNDCYPEKSHEPKRDCGEGFRDIYCDRPLPLPMPCPHDENPCNDKGTDNFDYHSSVKADRFSFSPTAKTSFLLLARTDGDAIADASDNDTKSGESPCDSGINVNFNFDFGEKNSAGGNQTINNDNDSVDVKGNGNGNGTDNNRGGSDGPKGGEPKGSGDRW